MPTTSLNAPRDPPAGDRLREVSGFEEQLALRQNSNAVHLSNETLARCLVRDCGSLPERREYVRNLPVAQRDLHLLELRRISIGDLVRSEVDCPSCGDASEVEFHLSQLPLKKADAQAVAVTLPQGPVRMRPVTAGDQESLLDRGAGRLDDVLLQVTSLSLSEIAALDESARDQLVQALDSANPDLDVKLSLSCHSCHHEMVAPFDIESFFAAELNTHAYTLLDDIHVLASTYHWSEQAILRLSWRRRHAYLARIEAERDAILLSGARER